MGSGIYLEKLDLNISLRLPDYCSVFQAEVIEIYRTAQWMLINGASFTRVLIFSNSQVAIRSLSDFVNNTRIVRECRCLDLFSERFTSVSIIWVFEHSNCRADEFHSFQLN